MLNPLRGTKRLGRMALCILAAISSSCWRAMYWVLTLRASRSSATMLVRMFCWRTMRPLMPDSTMARRRSESSGRVACTSSPRLASSLSSSVLSDTADSTCISRWMTASWRRRMRSRSARLAIRSWACWRNTTTASAICPISSLRPRCSCTCASPRDSALSASMAVCRGLKLRHNRLLSTTMPINTSARALTSVHCTSCRLPAREVVTSSINTRLPAGLPDTSLIGTPDTM